MMPDIYRNGLQNNAWQLLEMNCDEDKCDDYQKPTKAFLQNIYITQYIAR